MVGSIVAGVRAGRAPMPPPPAPGAPPPPPAPGAVAQGSVPKKASTAPSVPMKQLHWTKLPEHKVRGTIWEKEIDDSKVEIDKGELEQLFTAVLSDSAKESSAKTGIEMSISRSVKPQVVQLLDPKTANNSAIAISRFKMTPQEIADALTNGDKDAFTTDQLTSLLAILPSAEDVEVVSSYDGPVEQLGKAELFVKAISQVPRYTVRTRCLLLRSTFDEKACELAESGSLVSSAASEIKASSALRRVLATTLAVGNHLNGGTGRGAAWGFNLDSLSKLISTKTVDGKSTLLHHIARILSKSIAEGESECDAVLLNKQMPTLEAASRIVWQEETSELASLTTGLRQVETQAKTDTVEAFKKEMQTFYESAAQQAKGLHESFDKADKACVELKAWLGEDSKSAPETIFAAIHCFAIVLEKAHQYNLECIEKERRRRQKEEDRAFRRTQSLKTGSSDGSRRGGSRSSSAATGDVELAAKLAKGRTRADLVDKVETEMGTGKLLKARRQASFERREKQKRAAARAAARKAAAESEKAKSASPTKNGEGSMMNAGI